MPTEPRCERALFVLGDKNAGKTFQIRHMCADVRLGTNGTVPSKSKSVPRRVMLSNERLLLMRTQAPQEASIGNKYERVSDFYRKIDKAIKATAPRWNFVCPVRVKGRAKEMPGGIELIELFMKKYSPERVRVAILHPRKDGVLLDGTLPHLDFRDIADQIRKLPAEVMIVDARRKNGLLSS